ncbi:MAG: hypothetical protein ACK4Q4_00445 [Rhodocyclaceae bacterium]
MIRQRGLSKFEFAIVMALIAILAAVLLDRLVELEREAERLEVELALRNLRTGLTLAIGQKAIRGEEAKIGELLGANVLEWLGVAPEKIGAGGTAPRWRYDPATHVLSYRPRQPAAFSGHEALAWRLAPIRDPVGGATITIEPIE